MRYGRGNAEPRVPVLLGIFSGGSGRFARPQCTSLWWMATGMVLLFVGIIRPRGNPAFIADPPSAGPLARDCFRRLFHKPVSGIFVGGTAGGYVLGAGGVAAVSYTVLTVSAVWLLVAFNFRMEASTTTLQGE